MGEVTGWVVTVLGVAVVLAVLRDIFHTLWHPSGHGGLGRQVLAAIWRIGRPRRGHRRVRALAGPLAMVVVVMAWVALIVLGWTLIYWPHLDDGFFITESLKETSRGGLLDALYLSMVTLATLGFGDIVPTAEWLRVAVPLQAMLGFVLLTAVVTWVLQVYPALTRRRALAIRLSLLRRADAVRVLAEEDVPMAANLLEDLAGEVVQARVDLTAVRGDLLLPRRRGVGLAPRQHRDGGGARARCRAIAPRGPALRRHAARHRARRLRPAARRPLPAGRRAAAGRAHGLRRRSRVRRARVGLSGRHPQPDGRRPQRK